jgi:hypothetical protein
MATLFCKWPPQDQAKALAYNAECSAQYELLTSEENAVWANVRVDQNGNWTVPLLGPPWFFIAPNDFEEPASCAALRVDAVVVETPEWPTSLPEEEEE